MSNFDLKQMQSAAREACDLLKVLSNHNRLMILCNLVNGEKSVGTLQSLIGLSQSAISQHLARLRQEQLVQTRRVSQTVYYSLASAEVSQIIAVLYELYCQRE